MVVSHPGGLSSGDVLPLSPGFIIAMFLVGSVVALISWFYCCYVLSWQCCCLNDLVLLLLCSQLAFSVIALITWFIVAMFSVGNYCCLLPQAVSKMFKELRWEKIVIVYGDDAYGVGGYQEVLRAAYEAEVCVSGAVSVPHLGSDSEYEEKLRNIASYGATAAVFFGNPTDALSTMKVSC